MIEPSPKQIRPCLVALLGDRRASVGCRVAATDAVDHQTVKIPQNRAPSRRTRRTDRIYPDNAEAGGVASAMGDAGDAVAAVDDGDGDYSTRLRRTLRLQNTRLRRSNTVAALMIDISAVQTTSENIVLLSATSLLLSHLRSGRRRRFLVLSGSQRLRVRAALDETASNSPATTPPGVLSTRSRVPPYRRDEIWPRRTRG